MDNQKITIDLHEYLDLTNFTEKADTLITEIFKSARIVEFNDRQWMTFEFNSKIENMLEIFFPGLFNTKFAELKKAKEEEAELKLKGEE